ncbi:hypothetical protein B0I35DRAFT_404606 [Stachybotrys elegans]|uniref:Uncharacterized protein n=1 Tax=Stachybotrys elegans TaxID=80388 RepID=A0A8K0WXL3_9HYPO|nr:hypothetical protein B0I35DRAFT_404606 [Stachybotrys elegans]
MRHRSSPVRKEAREAKTASAAKQGTRFVALLQNLNKTMSYMHMYLETLESNSKDRRDGACARIWGCLKFWMAGCSMKDEDEDEYQGRAKERRREQNRTEYGLSRVKGLDVGALGLRGSILWLLVSLLAGLAETLEVVVARRDKTEKEQVEEIVVEERQSGEGEVEDQFRARVEQRRLDKKLGHGSRGVSTTIPDDSCRWTREWAM